MKKILLSTICLLIMMYPFLAYVQDNNSQQVGNIITNSKPEVRLAENGPRMAPTPKRKKECPEKCSFAPDKCHDNCYAWKCNDSQDPPFWEITYLGDGYECPDECQHVVCENGGNTVTGCQDNEGSVSEEECDKNCKTRSCDPNDKVYKCSEPKPTPTIGDCQSAECNPSTGEYYIKNADKYNLINTECEECGLWICNGTSVECIKADPITCDTCEVATCMNGAYYECQPQGQSSDECNACQNHVCDGTQHKYICTDKTEINNHVMGAPCSETDEEGCTVTGHYVCRNGVDVCETSGEPVCPTPTPEPQCCPDGYTLVPGKGACASWNDQLRDPNFCDMSEVADMEESDKISCCIEQGKKDGDETNGLHCTKVLPPLEDGRLAWKQCPSFNPCDYNGKSLQHGTAITGFSDLYEQGFSTVTCQGYFDRELQKFICNSEGLLWKSSGESIPMPDDYYGESGKWFGGATKLCCNGNIINIGCVNQGYWKCKDHLGNQSYFNGCGVGPTTGPQQNYESCEFMYYKVNSCCNAQTPPDQIEKCDEDPTPTPTPTPSPCNLSSSCDEEECAGLMFESEGDAQTYYSSDVFCNESNDGHCCTTDEEVYNDCINEICNDPNCRAKHECNKDSDCCDNQTCIGGSYMSGAESIDLPKFCCQNDKIYTIFSGLSRGCCPWAACVSANGKKACCSSPNACVNGECIDSPYQQGCDTTNMRHNCSQNSTKEEMCCGKCINGYVEEYSPYFGIKCNADKDCMNPALSCVDGVCTCDQTTPVASESPSESPSQTESQDPSQSPSQSPSQTTSESQDPSQSPSQSPSQTTSESQDPSQSPSQSPSQTESQDPSQSPSQSPSQTTSESQDPSQSPSQSPSQTTSESQAPSQSPSQTGSQKPSDSSSPGVAPTPYSISKAIGCNVSDLHATPSCPDKIELPDDYFGTCSGETICHKGSVLICASCGSDGQLVDAFTLEPVNIVDVYNKDNGEFFANVRCKNSSGVTSPSYKYAYTRADPAEECQGNIDRALDDYCVGQM